MPFGIQPIHLIIIVVVALIIFGPQKLPEIGRGLGRSLNEFRKGAREMTEGFRDEVVKSDTTPVPMQSQPMTPAAPAASAASAATVNCPNCGAANPSGASFCNKCGTKLAY